jgi:hypothetical protein
MTATPTIAMHVRGPNATTSGPPMAEPIANAPTWTLPSVPFTCAIRACGVRC